MSEPYYAQTPDDLLTAQDVFKLSGLDFIQGVLAGKYPAPPIGKTLNFSMYSAEFGQVVFRGIPLFDSANPLGTIHGGWYGTLLDSAMACAFQTTLPKGAAYTTLEYKINITRAIPIGMEIEAIGNVQHAGRSTGVAEGVIKGVIDGKTYATGSTTCLVLRPQS